MSVALLLSSTAAARKLSETPLRVGGGRSGVET
jgi:hypothetical protein